MGQRRGSHAAVAALQLLPLAVSKDVIGSGPKRGCAGWHRHAWLTTISKPGSHLARQPFGRHSARSGCRAAVQAAHGAGLSVSPLRKKQGSPAGYKLASAGRRVQHSACAAAAPPQLVCWCVCCRRVCADRHALHRPQVRTSRMNFLHTGRMSVERVALNIMTCLSWGVFLKMACRGGEEQVGGWVGARVRVGQAAARGGSNHNLAPSGSQVLQALNPCSAALPIRPLPAPAHLRACRCSPGTCRTRPPQSGARGTGPDSSRPPAA